METKYSCRRFILAVFFSIVSSCALFAGFIGGGEFCSLAGLVLGAYGGADVMAKKHKMENGQNV